MYIILSIQTLLSTNTCQNRTSKWKEGGKITEKNREIIHDENEKNCG